MIQGVRRPLICGAALTLSVSIAAVAQPAIDAASIRENPNPVTLDFPRFLVFEPGRLRAGNFSIEYLVGRAYGVSTGSRRQRLITGWPNAAIKDARFDIVASLTTASLTIEGQQRVVRDLLATRFAFKAHTEQRQMSVHRLALMKPGVLGPGLKRVDFNCAALAPGDVPKDKEGRSLCSAGNFNPVTRQVLSTRGGGNIQVLVTQLEGTSGGNPQLPREDYIIVDGTGLDGFFVWEYPTGGDRFANLREHLGLKLEPGMAQVPVVVIDQVRMPTPN